jgi:hypothetical protein
MQEDNVAVQDRIRDDALEEDLRKDPLVQETIERALAPYREIVSPELLEILAAMVEDALVTHPYAVGILQQLRALPARVSTGVQPKQMKADAGAAGGDGTGTHGA